MSPQLKYLDYNTGPSIIGYPYNILIILFLTITMIEHSIPVCFSIYLLNNIDSYFIHLYIICKKVITSVTYFLFKAFYICLLNRIYLFPSINAKKRKPFSKIDSNKNRKRKV